jgi:hypothetical protein
MLGLHCTNKLDQAFSFQPAWLPGYQCGWLQAEVIAGLAVGRVRG